MTSWRLVARSLFFYRKTGLVVAAALAVATAVITGSLVVGASVTGSLRDVALSRLGRIDHALVARHYFRAGLGSDLQSDQSLAGCRVVPAILTQGAATNADTDATVPHVSVVGADEGFAGLFGQGTALSLTDGQSVINESLARDLGVRAGGAVMLSLEQGGGPRSDTLFAQRKRERVIRSVRLDVAAVVPDAAMGGFRLDANPATPRNLFVPREWLASELGEPGRANTLLVGGNPQEAETLQTALAAHGTLADYGLSLETGPLGEASLVSKEMVLPDGTVRAARDAARSCGASAHAVSINLATTIRRPATGRSIAYALTAGIEAPAPFRFCSLGTAPLDRDGVLLNQWAAADLGARVGEALEVSTLVPSWDGVYREEKHRFILRGIVAMEGPGADPGLVPPIAGVTDADRVDDWEAPFPVNLKRVTPRDEEYWDRYHAAPKAFISLEAARDLWLEAAPPGAADWVTSVRFAPGAEAAHAALSPMRSRVEPETLAAAICSRLRPEDAGLAFRPVRAIARDAARGSTDFGQLFLALSSFLVLSAAALAGMTMRLLADRRAAETGTLLVCGFREGAVRRMVLLEGGILALIGGVAGVPLGVLYAWAIVRTLATRWVGAIGTSSLWLHADAAPLLAGGFSGAAVGLLSAWWGSRQAARRPVLELLAGWQSADVLRATKPGRGTRAACCLLALAAGLLLAAGAGALPPSGAFFGSGAALLVAGLLILRAALRRAMSRGGSAEMRSVAPRPGHSTDMKSVVLSGDAAEHPHGRRGHPPSEGRPAEGSEQRISHPLAPGSEQPIPYRSRPRAASAASSPIALALRSAAANPGRSLLIAGLFASAAFVLVATAANQRDASATDVRLLDSGTGGFTLRADASLPIGFDFGTPGGRERLGFPPEDEALFQGVTVVPFLTSPGEDVSCLNPTRPAAPRILGVPAAMMARGGFRVAGPAATSANPWEVLRQAAPGGGIAAFGDADSVMWTLHSGAGKVYRADVGGRQASLWFAGVIPGSVFAGELLVSEGSFRQLFPSAGGPRTFLIATPPGTEERVAEALRRNLGDAGLEVRPTSEVLTTLKRVQNTYLSAFLALDGLGMLLGTFGLVSALLRSVLERRHELAMMLAMGFEVRALARILVLENAGLLALGSTWGMACALLAVSPTLAASGTHVPWVGLIALLAGMAVLGLASCVLAARAAVGNELVAALREG